MTATLSLHPSRLEQAAQKYVTYAIEPTHGTTIEDMLKPIYWAHITAKLHPTDVIDALIEDGFWRATFHVVSKGHNSAKVVLLSKVDLDPAELPAEIDLTKHKIEWTGRETKWRISSRGATPADDTILKDRLFPRSEAVEFLLAYHGSRTGKAA